MAAGADDCKFIFRQRKAHRHTAKVLIDFFQNLFAFLVHQRTINRHVQRLDLAGEHRIPLAGRAQLLHQLCIQVHSGKNKPKLIIKIIPKIWFAVSNDSILAKDVTVPNKWICPMLGLNLC